MPNFPQNKNFRERPDCAVFLHGFNTNVTNWDTYREQCYQELKNKYRVYISKFDIGRFSESAYVHLKSPQDVQKLRNIDKYKDPKTGEMISRIKLAGGNVIVYPYCKDRNPNARQNKERSESVSSYRSNRSSVSVRSGRSQTSNRSNTNAWNQNGPNNFRRSTNRNISRDSSIASNRSSPISVNDAISSRRSHNQSSYSSQVVTDWSETEDNDYDDQNNSTNNISSPNRQNTITERMHDMSLSENKVKPVDSSITVKASESVVELNREDTVRPVNTQETVVPGSQNDKNDANNEEDLIIPNLSDAASVHSDYLFPEQVPNENIENFSDNNINYQSTSRSRAVSLAGQSGYCTENEEDLDENDEISFEKRFQNELKHNLPDVFWQLEVRENYISTLRNVYRNSKSEFLQTIIQYSKELNELHERILQKHQQEQRLAQQMAQQVYNQAQLASMQNLINNGNLASLNDSDMSSLLHYWNNNNNNNVNNFQQNQAQNSAPIQRNSNQPSISSDLGTNSVPQTPVDNGFQPNYQNIYNNNNFDPQTLQNNLAAAQMVSQVYNTSNNTSAYGSPINFPTNNETSGLVTQNLEARQAASPTVYNITNNYNNFANVNGAGGYEQNQMVKQPSA